MNRIVYLMAEGFGQAAEEFFTKQRHEAFMKVINTIFSKEEDRVEMVMVGCYWDHDEGARPFRSILSFERQLEEVFDMIVRFDASVVNKSDFYGCLREFNEHSDTQFQLMTRKDYDKWLDQQEMAKHEKAASAFAAKCGHKLGTMEFLAALDEAVNGVRHQREQWNSGERRAEEWAEHRFSGGGSESYFDDLNYVNSQFSQQREALEGVYDYLRKTCPILMCQYEEQRLQLQAN